MSEYKEFMELTLIKYLVLVTMPHALYMLFHGILTYPYNEMLSNQPDVTRIVFM